MRHLTSHPDTDYYLLISMLNFTKLSIFNNTTKRNANIVSRKQIIFKYPQFRKHHQLQTTSPHISPYHTLNTYDLILIKHLHIDYYIFGDMFHRFIEVQGNWLNPSPHSIALAKNITKYIWNISKHICKPQSYYYFNFLLLHKHLKITKTQHQHIGIIYHIVPYTWYACSCGFIIYDETEDDEPVFGIFD